MTSQDQNISAQGNMDAKTFILEGETVDSLLHSFIARSSQTLEQAQLTNLRSQVPNVIDQVKATSPSQVEQGDLNNFTDPVKSILSALAGKQHAVDDFFNTLNLCIVGLGSKLRGNL